MPTKTVIVALLSTTLLVGAVVSGCKRNRDDGLASAQSRRRTSRQHEVSSVRNVRPAEVLSASAYRPPVRRRQDAPQSRQQRAPRYDQQGYNTYQQNYPNQVSYQQPARRQPAYEPLPEPIPVSHLSAAPAYQYAAMQPVNYAQPTYVAQTYNQPAYAQPAYAQQPTFAQPNYQQPVAGTPQRDDRYSHLPEYAYKPTRNGRPENPDLAMARARLAPLQANPHNYNRQPLPAPAVEAIQPMQPVQPYNNANPYNDNYNRTQAPNDFNYSPDSAPVPGVVPSQFNSAPIPELEPVRYQRVAAAQPRPKRRVPEITALAPIKPPQPRQQQQVAAYITGREQAEVTRALAPINQAKQAPQPKQAPDQPIQGMQPLNSAEWIASAPMIW